jgi:hypothetical protein
MVDEFSPFQPKAPAFLRSFRIVIKYVAENPPIDEVRSVRYTARFEDDEGRPMSFHKDTGNLVPYMTAGEVTAMKSFLQKMIDKAEKLIP